eukprot:GHVN01068712.1.p1 GENE.GHVN01068712.1~~GHVN01068712.1.p1  ORF type:complete len:235 (-),score=25.44 GHVN01068712.1:681-1385(-)
MTGGVSHGSEPGEFPRQTPTPPPDLTRAHSGLSQKHHIRLSKSMAEFLRHSALRCGAHMGPDGYVEMSEMLDHLQRRSGLNYTVDDVVQCVQENTKQRFGIVKRDDKLYVRAQQGHTIRGLNDELLLTRIEDPRECPVVVHGTFQKHLADIQRDGLRLMGRNHIHFFPPPDSPVARSAVVSGPRPMSEVFIYVDVSKAMEAGVVFYRSANNVILTSGIDGVVASEFFLRVKQPK